jgi:hypothetical protein
MNDIPISKNIVYEFQYWSNTLLSPTITTIAEMIADLKQANALPELEAHRAERLARLAEMEQAGVTLFAVIGQHWFCLRTKDKAVADRFGFVEARHDHYPAYVELRLREGRKTSQARVHGGLAAHSVFENRESSRIKHLRAAKSIYAGLCTGFFAIPSQHCARRNDGHCCCHQNGWLDTLPGPLSSRQSVPAS